MGNKFFYIDTHAHLDILDKDLNNISLLLDRFFNDNINLIFNISVNFNQFSFFSKKLNKYDKIYFSLGLSPNDINTLKKNISLNSEKIEDLVNNFNLIKNYIEKEINHFYNLYKDKVIGIGEIGLDYYWNKDNKDLQKSIFLVQVEKAYLYNLPIILHIREAFEDLVLIIKDNKNIFNKLKIIFHCFSGDVEIIKKLEKLGMDFYYSFAGNITYPKASNLREAFIFLPFDKIILETDSPFLTPVPKRGQKNSPENIKLIYKFCSELKNIEENFLKEKIIENVFKIFDKTLFCPNSRIY